jgi:hypothetical protein
VEGGSRDGSRDAGTDGVINRDGAFNGAQDDTTDGTLNVALNKAGKCRWDDQDEDLVNICSVSLV